MDGQTKDNTVTSCTGSGIALDLLIE